MNKIVLLHTNDIHGRVEGLARVATLVERDRAQHEGVPVLYLDLGESEEYFSRLSSLTKGTANNTATHSLRVGHLTFLPAVADEPE